MTVDQYNPIYLPVQDWPAQDQSAWDAMFADGDVFDSAGAARHWAKATRRTNHQHYARWLGWLKAGGRLDDDRAPWERVDRASVTDYVSYLKTAIGSVTVASTLVGLKVVMKAMQPDADWRWLARISNRLGVLAEPRDTRDDLLPASSVLFNEARAELDRLIDTPLKRRKDRVAFRDTLMIMMLAAAPVRLRNLSAIEIGIHLVRTGTGWSLHFQEAETKNRQRLRLEIPTEATPYIAVYLERVRACFGPAPDCTTLWLTFEGAPMAQHTIHLRIKWVTARLFGEAINPHRFRAAAATTLVEEAPEAARLAAPLLGHRYFSTTERYYIRASQIVASRAVNEAILNSRMSERIRR
jgi:site-specific recombinase XerD